MHRRRKVLQYLYRVSPKRYHQIMADLNLRSTVAPPLRPGYVMRHEAFRTTARNETKAQRRARLKAGKKLK